jgi:uroporphyrinogen decarboxylase
MTPRESLVHALERRPPIPGSRVPHFELVYFLTMEAFGKVHPCHRNYEQWHQMSQHERQLHRIDQAQLYIDTAERFGHSAILLHPHQELSYTAFEEMRRTIELVRELSGDRFLLMLHGDATPAIPNGAGMEELSLRMLEEPESVEADIEAKLNMMLDLTEKLVPSGLDGQFLGSDYCFNTGPFLPLPWFDRFVTPYLKRLIDGYRSMGIYVIKHTDGNIMPIIDRLVDARPHALHSLDPQGGVDIAEVKRLYGDRICLCGNVNCGLMDTGTDEQVVESARYALKHGMPGGSYVFATSNCVYTGMRPERYELILDVWRREGIYPE